MLRQYDSVRSMLANFQIYDWGSGVPRYHTGEPAFKDNAEPYRKSDMQNCLLVAARKFLEDKREELRRNLEEAGVEFDE